MGMISGQFRFSNVRTYLRKIIKILKESFKTHLNWVPRALGALKSKSTWKMLPKSWFKVEKGVRNVGFMTETMLKINGKWRKLIKKLWKLMKYVSRPSVVVVRRPSPAVVVRRPFRRPPPDKSKYLEFVKVTIWKHRKYQQIH